MRLFDRLWVLSLMDSIATYTWRRPPPAYELRVDYLAALCHLQPWTSLQWERGRPAVTFNNWPAIADFIRREAWSTADTDGNKYLFPSDQHPRLTSLVDQGFRVISGLSNDLSELIHLTIGELLLAQKQGHGGGSMSSAVGLIWLNPGTEWDAKTMGENIVHEWVHNMLFLADMVTPIFAVNYLVLRNESSLVTSAILRRKRPFDRSYHSAAVAAGLVFFHTIAGDTYKADLLVGPALTTVNELKGKRELMTQTGFDMLEEMETLLRTRDCSHTLAVLAGNAHPQRAGVLELDSMLPGG